MKKSFILQGREVEFTECTAIESSIGDTERQNAVFVHDTLDEFGDGDGVVFGVGVPSDAKEAASILYEFIDTDYTTLETVKIISD